MAEYLVKDFTKADRDYPIAELWIVRDDIDTGPASLWAILDEIKQGKRKAAIYRLGDSVLDWS